jgi:subtilisin-like proprotein convertase family protein
MVPLPVINSFTATPSSVCSGVPFTLAVAASGGTYTSIFSSGTINQAIPDNTPAGISSTIPVSSNIILDAANKLSVTLNFGTTAIAPNREHTYVGDLKVTLSTPGGNTIIFDRPGSPLTSLGNSADMNGSYTFTTTATSILPQTASVSSVVAGNVVNGSYKPSDSSNPDAAHNWTGLTFPLAINGNWTLTISDNAGSDAGDLISWSISVPAIYSHVFSGPGAIGTVNCGSSNCENASATVTNATPGLQTFSVVTTSPDGCTVSSNVNVQTSCSTVLNLKMFIDGFYRGSNTMTAVADKITHPTLCDTVTVELHETVSPYNLAYTVKDTLNTNGNGKFTFPSAAYNQSYFIVVHHRNALETWSKTPVLFNAASINYDFTTAASKAFGNNQKDLGDGNFALWSGDVTNGFTSGVQNGAITLADFNEVKNTVQGFDTGYKINDLTGDGIIEASDFSLMENNYVLSIVLMRP